MNGIETEFYWIRHLPIVKTGRYTGHTDVPAIIPPTPANIELPKNAVWYASPLLRCQQTAEWLGKKNIAFASEIMEQNFGKWEGKTYDEVWEEEQNYHDWSKPELIKPPHGESFFDVCLRVEQWINAKTNEAKTPLVIIAHAGTIRAAIRQKNKITMSEALSINIEYLSLHKISR